MAMQPKAHNEAFLALVNDAKTRIQEVTVEQYQAMQAAGEDCLLIDVREESEWAAGHAAGALQLGKGIIERDIEMKVPDKSKKLVLYCGGGFRSALAADALRIMGYQSPMSLAGGWRAIVNAGMATEK